VIDGMLTLRKIEAVTVGANSKPKLPILISQCGVRSDPGRLPRRGEAHNVGWGHNELRAIRDGVGVVVFSARRRAFG